MLRQIRLYESIVLNKQIFKVSLFADYGTVLFNGSALRCNYAFDILNAFWQRSGDKINMFKSSVFYVKSSKGKVTQPFSANSLSWPQALVNIYVLTYLSTILITIYSSAKIFHVKLEKCKHF